MGFVEQKKNDINFMETMGQMSNCEVNKGTKTILGNKKHTITFYLYFEGNKPIYFRGTMKKAPPGRVSYFAILLAVYIFSPLTCSSVVIIKQTMAN